MQELIFRRNIEISKFTTIKAGGNADFFFIPKNEDALVRAVMQLSDEEKDFLLLGKGSNLIVGDEGFPNVIRFGSPLFTRSLSCGVLHVSAGDSLIACSLFSCQNSLSGLEWAAGIPGTIGGAVVMNAGAFGGQMSDVVESVEALIDGRRIRLNNHECGFKYRSSVFRSMAFKERAVVLSCDIKLNFGCKDKLLETVERNKRWRMEHQPIGFPTAGSTFKRPVGGFAGELIERCGLKGFRIGGAEVSRKHANFLINIENASASDFVKLIEHIEKEVLEKFDIALEREVIVICKRRS